MLPALKLSAEPSGSNNFSRSSQDSSCRHFEKGPWLRFSLFRHSDELFNQRRKGTLFSVVAEVRESEVKLKTSGLDPYCTSCKTFSTAYFAD